MSWTTLRHSIDASIEDHAGEIAYRSAARIIPQCSKGYSPSRRAKEIEAPLVLAIMRGLMAARVGLDGFDPQTRDAVDRAQQSLARYSQFTSHVAHSINELISDLFSNCANRGYWGLGLS